MDRETSRRVYDDSARANEALQNNLQRSESRILASYALIGAIILFGGLGYVVDRWAHTSPWFLMAGLLVGIVFGFFRLLRSVSINAD
jgi:F0F1-type ATP synthase assembly protein I